MNAHEAGLLHEVGGPDRPRAEAEVGHRHRPRLLRVVDEVALGVELGALRDDLDRVLVGADGPVGSESVEERAHLTGLLEAELGVQRQREVGHVVVDAHCEVVVGMVGVEVIQDRLDHRRRELLRREAVATAEHPGIGRHRQLAGGAGLADRGDHVLVERLSEGTRLLGPIEDCDAADRRRKRGDKMLQTEGAVETNLEGPDLLASIREVLDRLSRGLGAGAHEHDDPLGLRMTDIVEELVAPAGAGREALHLLDDDLRASEVEGVAGFASLEEGVGILGGAADRRMVRAEGALAVVGDRVFGDESREVLVAQHLDPAHLVRSPEAVEEVQEGDPRPQGGSLGDAGQIVGLLHRVRGQHGEAALAAGHHVGVIPEDRERVGGQAPGRHVDDQGIQLPGDLVHRRDLQEQPLGGGEGRAQRARLQRAVDRADGAALGLHLDHVGDQPPDVGALLRGPRIRELAHCGGWGDRIYGDDLVRSVRHRGSRFVSVEGRPNLVGHERRLLGLLFRWLPLNAKNVPESEEPSGAACAERPMARPGRVPVRTPEGQGRARG